MRNKENTDCNNAIKRVFEKIDINKINTFIDEIQSISDIRKEFYKKIINMQQFTFQNCNINEEKKYE